MKIITISLVFIFLLGCNNGYASIDAWQKHLRSQDKKIQNIILTEKNSFFLSLNKRNDGFYAVFYKNLNKKKITSSIETWVETYHKNRKVILDAGYAIQEGVYFKQSEAFDQIELHYRIGDETKIFIFVSFEGQWKLEKQEN